MTLIIIIVVFILITYNEIRGYFLFILNFFCQFAKQFTEFECLYFMKVFSEKLLN